VLALLRIVYHCVKEGDIRICQLAAAIGLFFEFQKSGESLSLKSVYERHNDAIIIG
jgi:hypothetical protein